MGFVESREELAQFSARDAFAFYDAEMVWVVWETTQACIERLLPPPLKPAQKPLALAFVANYPRTDFGITYRETAIALQAEFAGIEGSYILGMHVTDDMALLGGREIWGYPKKMADIAFYREGTSAGGWGERHGIRYLSVQAELTGKVNTPDAAEAFTEVFGQPDAHGVSFDYNFKYFPSPDWQGFDYAPRLVRGENAFQLTSMELGEARVTLRPSKYDPWSDVEIVRVLGAMYVKGDLSMRKGVVVAQADSEAFRPYGLANLDPLQ
jgi:acetoacetate decarboxylase